VKTTESSDQLNHPSPFTVANRPEATIGDKGTDEVPNNQDGIGDDPDRESMI